MSTGPHETSSYGMQPPQKRGMSTGAKVLLILGIVFGCLFLLCCGGVFLTGWWMKSNTSDDPAVVARATDEIVQIDVPDGLQPALSMDIKIPFTGQQLMVIVVHADEDTGSALMLIAMGEMMVNQNQEEMRRSIDQQLQGQSRQGHEDIVVEESYDKELEIRGQPARFTISKGVGKKSNTRRIQVVGVFQGKTGPVMLMFNGQADKFSEEQVVAMLESIGRDESPRAAEKQPHEGPVTDD